MTLTINDINNIETEEYVDDHEYYASIQRAINSGSWSFQGSYGRTMMAAIDAGYCVLGRKEFKDYYGNGIPSRDQVQPGTKGSADYVLERQGQEWLDFIVGVE
jgi:hypothetical protein